MSYRIAIAIGDPNGIGAEIAVKSALRAPAGTQIVLVGDEHVLAENLRAYGEGRHIETVIVNSLPADAFRPGELSAEAGAATVAYLKKAMSMAMAGKVDAVIGGPASETAISLSGIWFRGNQPFLADFTNTPRNEVFMMLVAENLKIAHVTLHEGLRSVLDRINPEMVVNAVRATHEALRRLGEDKPRIALFGLNPHAGEGGLFGDEDERITKPAAEMLRKEGIDVTGPHPGDLVLSQRAHSAYVAMYHDQGHIPIKLLSPFQASALTIGLPVLFASVAHGCAHDIAGQGKASPLALMNTISLLSERIQRRN